ncbi:hypothetical protein [Haloferula sargassicola]|uniref:Uncharacterized protein n=1 Tax=Haloferula sargassicola TaxID=490096 RepID=A0ABP9USB8_9BACT
MQLTRFDRWLRKKFVYQTHLYALRKPEVLPAGIRVEELPEAPGRQYHFKFSSNSEKSVTALIQLFTEHNQIYTTRIVDRRTWYTPFIAPKGGKSVTWWCVWAVIFVIGGFTLTSAIRGILNNPTVRENLAGAWETLKG